MSGTSSSGGRAQAHDTAGWDTASGPRGLRTIEQGKLAQVRHDEVDCKQVSHVCEREVISFQCEGLEKPA